MKSNILGDIRAEHDTKMLEAAFWPTSDYKALLESNERCIIVGRRGTGKSALVHMLSKHWHQKPKTHVMNIAPVEEHIIGFRDTMREFGDNYLHVKAGSKLAWRYAICMEVLVELTNHYKLKSHLDIKSIEHHISSWGARKKNIASKIRIKLNSIFDKKKGTSSEAKIADLSDDFELELLEEVILDCLNRVGYQVVIFADRLDEGYSPDPSGVAIIDGFIQAVSDIRQRLNGKVSAFAFVRDNIYRAISKMDPDFTRNIEGQALRLHWDEYNLYNMVCNRLRVAFDLKIENNTRVWNACTANELKAKEGFRLTLKLTLYRPRDILVLLNDAFLRANSQDRREIILEDIDVTAKTISINRLNDLQKEYEVVFPALDEFVSQFSNTSPELSFSSVESIIEFTLQRSDVKEKNKLQDILLFRSVPEVIQRLYSIGFLGLYNKQSSSYVFCHDGKDPDRDFSIDSKFLIHPCYWLALGATQSQLRAAEAEDIHDEYDIEVSSVSEEQRKQQIGALLQELSSIPEGMAGAHDFEQWCLKTIRIIFATDLVNIELHSNKNGLQQRDIIATNLGDTAVWKRVLSDYQTRQVIFEIKNYNELGAAEYRQISSYMSKEYGRLAFIVNRDHSNNLEKNKELNWAKELYDRHDKMVVKLSSKFLEKSLSKARSPQKHDAVNTELNKLLDMYIRVYLTNKCK